MIDGLLRWYEACGAALACFVVFVGRCFLVFQSLLKFIYNDFTKAYVGGGWISSWNMSVPAGKGRDSLRCPGIIAS